MKQIAEARTKMLKTINTFYSQIQGMRRGSLDSGFVSTLKVPAYGQKTAVGHLAEIYDGDGRISVIPYDPSLTGSIAKGLKESGLEAYKFSKTEVAISKPPPSGEDTRKICEQVNRLGEEAKVGIRNTRKKCKQQLKRLELDEAELGRAEKQLQKLTDAAIKEVTETVTDKITKLKEEVSWQSSSRRKKR